MDDMEISGRVISVLPEQSGEGRNGPWRKQDYIVETGGQFPRKVCVTVWGDKIEQFAIREGEEVTFSVNVESREFNQRWYTDVKAWKVEKGAGEGGAASRTPDQFMNTPPPQDAPPPSDDQIPPLDQEDDLPF